MSSNILEKHIRMTLSKKKLSKLPEDSTGINKKNIVDRYMIRPEDVIFENLCFGCSLIGISCKQNHLRMIHNQKNW